MSECPHGCPVHAETGSCPHADPTWHEFDTTAAAPEPAPDPCGATVYLLGGGLLDALLVAHHDDPGLPIVMLSPEIPEQVLKSVILAALLRLETE